MAYDRSLARMQSRSTNAISGIAVISLVIIILVVVVVSFYTASSLGSQQTIPSGITSSEGNLTTPESQSVSTRIVTTHTVTVKVTHQPTDSVTFLIWSNNTFNDPISNTTELTNVSGFTFNVTSLSYIFISPPFVVNNNGTAFSLSVPFIADAKQNLYYTTEPVKGLIAFSFILPGEN